MCRYAIPYKPHYACFECRKTFKRRLLYDVDHNKDQSKVARCPECGHLMANMGLDFKSPKKDDLKTWQHIKDLYSVGVTFHSCGCTGPGYIPANKEKLIEYLLEKKEMYVKNLRFWINRKEPENKQEIQRDIQTNADYRWQLPRNLINKKYQVENQNAIAYWNEKLALLDEQIKSLS